MNGQRGLDWLSAACFLGLLAVLSIFAVVNLDLGFHLRAGELIWQEGRIPSNDVFSYIAEGRPWVDSHWLFQLVLHGVYQLGDANGLIALRVVLVVATFGLLLVAARRFGHFHLALALCVLAVFVSYQRFVLRPELLSFCFLAFFVLGAERFREAPKFWLVFLPLLEVFWANAHGLHVLGPIYLGLRLLGDFLQGWAHRALPGMAAPRAGVGELKQRLGLLGLCTLGVLLNGNGIAGILYPYQLFFELGGQVDWFPVVEELRSPLMSGLPRTLFDPIAFYWAFMLCSLGALIMSRGEWQLSDLLPFVVFAALSLMARRNAPLFALVAVPIVVRWLASVGGGGAEGGRVSPSLKKSALTLAAMAGVMIATAAGAASGALYEGNGWLRRFGVGESEFYPSGLIPRLREIEGRFLNHPNIGGYLIWKLYPEHQVALDGRWEVYGDLQPQVVRAFWDSERLAALVEEYDIRAVVLMARPSNRGIIRRLQLNPDFRLTRRTRNAVLFEKVESP